MSKRINKINQLLQQELAKLIQREMQGQLVTVTAVETALDLKTSKVWISVYLQDGNEIVKQLKTKAPYFQSYLGKKLVIKNIPKLSFHLDKSQQHVDKIEKLLKK